MQECEYWWGSDSEQWCDLMAGECNCKGLKKKCLLDAATMADAIKQRHKPSLKDLSNRFRRRHRMDEAS